MALSPASVLARYNLGVVYRDLELFEDAWVEFISVIAADGRMAGAYNNLAVLEERLELHRAAEWHFRKAILLNEAFPDAQFNLGLLLLRLGRFQEGFARCEWRWQTSRFTPFRAPHPRWDGSRLSGTLLVHSEQGRWRCNAIRTLPPHGRRALRSALVLLPRKPLPALSVDPRRGGIAWSPGPVDPTEFQAYIPLMSLPHVLGMTLETLPSRVPYLQPEPRSLDLGSAPFPESTAQGGADLGRQSDACQ